MVAKAMICLVGIVLVCGRAVGAPTLGWATHVGGPRGSGVVAAAADSAGNIYVTGRSNIDTTGRDYTASVVYVCKYSPAGELLWNKFYRGYSADNQPHGIAVDREDNFYLAVEGDDPDGLDPAQVYKISSDGNVIWSRVLNQASNCKAVGVDDKGNVYVTGATSRSGWVSGGYDTIFNGGDGYLVKYDRNGVMLWSTYIGGAGRDEVTSIAVKGDGKVYVAGQTDSIGWVSGGYDKSYNGGSSDGFVVKVSASGGHTWSTYIGGVDGDRVNGLALDGSGNLYVTGNIDFDAYVAKLSGVGEKIWLTEFGGKDAEFGRAVVPMRGGGAAAVGGSISPSWVSGGFDLTNDGPIVSYGSRDAFVIELAANGSHRWSSFLGAERPEDGTGIAVVGDSFLYVAGGGYWPDDGRPGSGFLARINLKNALAPEFWMKYR